MHTADLIPKNTDRTQTSVHCLTTRSAFPLSVNLTLQINTAAPPATLLTTPGLLQRSQHALNI